MDDARIRALAEEVLGQIRPEHAPAPSGDLESRVAALEAALRELRGSRPAALPAVAAVIVATAHPSQALLGVPGGGTGACLMEPDKPCVGSGACRSFGH